MNLVDTHTHLDFPDFDADRSAVLDTAEAGGVSRVVVLGVHRANLDRLAETGLPIYVTELDIDGPTDAEQLASYQRVFPVFWEHPGVHGVTLWGFRPGLWREKEGAFLVRADGSERPALKWLRDYVRKTPLRESASGKDGLP